MASDKFLLIDTTTSVSSFALFENGSIVQLHHHYESQQQAAAINLIIQQLLKDNNWQINELTGVGICSGPGSYTGMRIGYSVAKGICFGLEIPMMAIAKFDVLTFGKHYSELFVAIKARQEEYFIAYRKENVWQINPQHASLAKVTTWIDEHQMQHIMTDDAATFATLVGVQILKIEDNVPLDMQVLGQLCQERMAQQIFDDIAYAEPLYLKSVYTTASKKKSLF